MNDAMGKVNELVCGVAVGLLVDQQQGGVSVATGDGVVERGLPVLVLRVDVGSGLEQ
jgi:hypothetical protein